MNHRDPARIGTVRDGIGLSIRVVGEVMVEPRDKHPKYPIF